MLYWPDMTDKHGFLDGEREPENADAARDAYVKAVNRVAAVRGSSVRVIPFNRPGLCNRCMVAFVAAAWFNKEYRPAQAAGTLWKSEAAADFVEPDQLLLDAVGFLCHPSGPGVSLDSPASPASTSREFSTWLQALEREAGTRRFGKRSKGDE